MCVKYFNFKFDLTQYKLKVQNLTVTQGRFTVMLTCFRIILFGCKYKFLNINIMFSSHHICFHNFA